jgi:hypothetical protein
MIGQLKFLLDIFLSTNTVIIQFCLVKAAVNPDKNETDYIAQYLRCVKEPMGGNDKKELGVRS